MLKDLIFGSIGLTFIALTPTTDIVIAAIVAVGPYKLCNVGFK